MNNRVSLKQIIDILKKNNTFFITSHENPDGDSIACETGLALFLEFLGKKKYSIVNRDGVPKVYRFLPRAQKIQKAEKVAGTFDVALIVDTTDEKRFGGVIDLKTQARTVIVIDHHLSSEHFGDYNFIDTETASCTELIYKIISYEIKKITPQMATCLYVGIMTETNRFQEANTTVDAFRAAAELTAAGANPNSIARKVYEENSYAQLGLLSAALSTLKLYCDGDVASMEVTQRMMRKAGAEGEETEGFINFPRSIEGVKVAMLFRENSKGVKVSLRSRDATNVSKIAVHFGGGGHRRAAGFFRQGTLKMVKQEILTYVGKQIKNGCL